jgi:hypothetical protein
MTDRRPVAFVPEDQAYVFECPTCGCLVQVAVHEVNCQIFRHAAFVVDMQPIPPHTSEPECARLVGEGLVVGCGGPFRLVFGAEPYAERCGYI